MKPLLKFVGFLLIIGLSVLAQNEFANYSTTGYLYLGAAGVIALILIAPVPSSDVSGQQSAILDVARGWWRWFVLIVLLAGLVICADSARQFHTQLLVTEVPNDAPWIEFAIGLAITFVSTILLVGVGRLPRPDVTMLILVGIVALAFFIRVYQVDQYPFGIWFDEALYGLDARHILADPTFRPIFTDVIAFPHLLAYTLGYLATHSILGMRIATAILATFGVIIAYLVGRELRGKWFGLLMAALLAFMQWSFNPSRIAFPGADTVTFTLIAFYGALRLARYGRLRDAVWFGLAVGVGGYFYGQYQPQVLAIGLYLLLAYPFRRRRWWRTLVMGLTAVLAAVILLIPLLLFAIDHGNDYFNRLNQVSVFQPENRPQGESLLDTISQSTITHLEMFHLHGDNNGRHNLPGTPMLDPAMGALLVIGLFVALREHRREHLLFFASLILALLGGILSLWFEAPQSHRAIAAIVGVIYFSALGIEGMARLALSWLTALPPLRPPRISRTLVGLGALAAICFTAAWNLDLYFNQERTDFSVWNSFSTAESVTGQILAAAPPQTQFYISPLIGSDAVSVQFLAANALNRSHQLIMSDPFPLRVAPTDPATIMLVPIENIYLDYLHQLYPNAAFKPVRASDYGIPNGPSDPLVTTVTLSPEDVGALQGLRDGRGILYVPRYDQYSFNFDSSVHLQIDNQAVTSAAPVELAEGNHTIAVTPPDASLTWQSAQDETVATIPLEDLYHDPVTPNGLIASFYKNGDFAGDPVNKRILPFVYWMIQIIPMDRPYSVRYDGYLYTPIAGDYKLNLNVIDTAALDVDGKNVLTTTAPNTDTMATVTLDPGWHPVEVRFQDLTSSSRIFLSWSPPGASDYSPISRDYFCPALDLCAPPAPPAGTVSPLMK